MVGLYRGRVVEDTSTRAFAQGGGRQHPYTQLLWRSARYVAGGGTSLPEKAVNPPVQPLSGGCA